MRGTYRIYRWLVAVWLIMAGTIMSPVRAYTYATQPSAWRTTPTLSQDIAPSCTFRSTSSYAPIVGQTTYTSSASFEPVGQSAPYRMRRGMDDEDPEGDAVGNIDTPVGSPLVLLLFAVLFIVLKRKKSYAE